MSAAVGVSVLVVEDPILEELGRDPLAVGYSLGFADAERAAADRIARLLFEVDFWRWRADHPGEDWHAAATARLWAEAVA